MAQETKMGAQKLLSTITASIVCPECKRTGSIVSEDQPVGGGYGQRSRLIHKLSAGFVTVDFSSSQDARVECADCRVGATEG